MMSQKYKTKACLEDDLHDMTLCDLLRAAQELEWIFRTIDVAEDDDQRSYKAFGKDDRSGTFESFYRVIKTMRDDNWISRRQISVGAGIAAPQERGNE